MDDRIGVVWNPSKADGDELRSAFDQAVAAADLTEEPEVRWFETTPEDPGQEATASALEAGCALVVAAGGDGTVRAVAERLGGAASSGERPSGSERSSDSEGPPAELAVVPLGTGNLLARNLGVPLSGPRQAFGHALTRSARPLDLGEVTATLTDGGELRQGFVVMVGFGIDAQMIAETDDELKAKAGWLAYVESLGRAAGGTEVVPLELSVDGGEPRAAQAHTLLVGNCGMIQGGITLLPAAQPDDGRLDLLMLSADDAASWLDTVGNMVWENGLKRLVSSAKGENRPAESSESANHVQAESLRIELSEAQPFEIDGDEVGEVSAFSVRLLPAALRVRA